MKTQHYLDTHFRDPKLKAALVGQWPDYGATPSESAFGIHSIVAADFQHGGYYPIGGSQLLADGAAEMIEKHGGQCLVNHAVKAVLVEDNRAIGVRVEHKGRSLTYVADRIVSNAGAATTFNKLVPHPYAVEERARLTQARPGPSAMILFLGLNQDPRNQGFEDCNYWLFSSLDHNQPMEPDSVIGAFVSFGSLRNPGQQPHTAQIVTLSQEDHWSEFAHSTTWKRRGGAYEGFKETWSDRLLDFAEARLPGLRSMVDYKELSSPLTVKSFLDHPSGQIYGHACSPARLKEGSWSIGTSVKDLYLTGSDVAVPGVNSALMIGVMTAGKLLGWLGMPRILTRVFSAKSSAETN